MPFAEFAPYRPDSPTFQSGATQLARNVLPLTDQGYGPLPSLTNFGNALDGRCQGAGGFLGPDGTIVNFAGTFDKIYLWNGSTWVDVSRLVGGAYTTPAEQRWVFIQFDIYVVAINGIDADQVWTIGLSTNWVALSTLGDTPEVARYAAVCQNILMLGYTASNVQGVVNSDFFNIGEWTPGTGAADDQDLPNSGRITGLTSGQYINIFQERRITLATPTKAIPAFQFDPVSEERGCVVPGSITGFQQTIFFIANDGFFRLDGGQQLTPIGDKEVDREFWDNVNQDFLYRVTAVVDPRRKLYVVSFPDFNSTDGTPNRTLFFNWTNQSKRWTTADFGVDVLFFMYAQLSVDLDTDSGEVGDSNLDTVGLPSLDSDIYLGNPIPKLAAFTSNFMAAVFEGANMAATIDSMEAELVPDRQADIDMVRPMIEGSNATITVTLGTRDRLNDTVSFGSPVTQTTFGECYFREHARYFRARTDIAAAGVWTHARGVEFVPADGGDR